MTDNLPLTVDGQYTVQLQPRHAQWLERFSALQGNSPERQIEIFIREAMARDSTKGGTAGGGTGRAQSFVPAAGGWKA